MRGHRNDRSIVELPTVEVFAVGEDGTLVPPTDGHLSFEPVMTWIHERMDDQSTRSPRVTIAAGPGTHAPAAARRSCGEEVFLATPIDPRIALMLAARGDLFAEPLPWIAVQSGSAETEAPRWGMAWRARVGAFPRRLGRAAILRMYSSPSTNLTLIQLVPVHARAFGVRRFVFGGLRAVRGIAARLELLGLQHRAIGQPGAATAAPDRDN